ncbi:MAG: S-layer homology domain-containing protein [Halanaerobiales bacterium]
MKRFNSSLIVLTLIFIMLFSISTFGAEMKDVPESHWAYESVNFLVEKGYFSLYEDDTFKGTNKVSRYELAEIIARMLRDTAAGETEMSDEDVDTLRELSLDFRDELVDIANKQNAFSENLNKVQKKNVIQDEEIGNTNEKITEVQEEVSQIIDEIATQRDKIDTLNELNNRVETLSNKVNTLEEDLRTTNEEVAEKDQKIEELRTELQESDIQELRDENSALESKVTSLQDRLQELQQNVNDNNEQLTELTSSEEDSEFKAGNTTLYLGAAVLLALLLGT